MIYETHFAKSSEPRYYQSDGSKIALLPCGRGSTTAVAVKFFLPFLNEFGNSKLFELFMIFYCHRCGTTMAMEVV